MSRYEEVLGYIEFVDMLFDKHAESKNLSKSFDVFQYVSTFAPPPGFPIDGESLNFIDSYVEQFDAKWRHDDKEIPLKKKILTPDEKSEQVAVFCDADGNPNPLPLTAYRSAVLQIYNKYVKDRKALGHEITEEPKQEKRRPNRHAN
jgi:hypothetical protein